MSIKQNLIGSLTLAWSVSQQGHTPWMLSGSFRMDPPNHISSKRLAPGDYPGLALRRKQYSHAFLSRLLSTELDR
jgi:hypothetical protein